MRKRWWAVRWHVLRVVVGNPLQFGAAMLDAACAFRRAFADTWLRRWRAGDAEEAWRRFGPTKEGEHD